MKTLTIALFLILSTTFAACAWAKRMDPKPVAPVIHDGVKYTAPLNNGREGRVEARDEKTGVKLWDAVIYKVKIDPNLEEDVQWVFITSLAIKDGKLIVTNEKKEKYSVDLKTRKVEKVKNEERPKKTEIEPTKMTIDAVTPLVREFAFQKQPSLTPPVRFEIKEYDVEGLWKVLHLQLFHVRYLSENGTEFNVKSMMLHDGKMADFVNVLGGYGLMSAVLQDDKLYYTYSFGSGLHRSHVGRLSAIDGKVKIIESHPFFETDFFVKEVGGRIQVESGEFVAFNSWKEPKQIGRVNADDKSIRVIDAAGNEVPEDPQH